MRKLQVLLLATLMIIAMAGVSSAEGLYIRMGSGYGLGIGGTGMGRQQTTENTWTKDVGVNVGQGFPIAADVGFKINENLAVEVGAGYTIGMAGEISNTALFSWGGYGDTTTYSYTGSWIPVTVAIKCNGQMGALKPYFSVGTGIYFGTVIQKYTQKKGSSSGPKIEKEITMTGASLGVNSSVGVEFAVSEMISIFAEGRFDHVTFTPATGEITKYLEDDVDKLSTLNANQKHNLFLWPITADCLSIRGGVVINL